MGTWGAEAWENDVAADWLAGLEDRAQVAATLSLGDLPLDADAAAEALIAAEVVAAMKGRPAPGLPDTAREAAQHFGAPDFELEEAAKYAVSAVIGGSELTQLWVKDGPAPFNRAITHLIDRLNPEKPYDPRPVDEDDFERPCLLCGVPVPKAELYSITLSEEMGKKPKTQMIAFVHLACFNGLLSPNEMIQDWQVSQEFIDREMAKR